MRKCTDAVAEWLVRCNAIEKEDKELYSYAVYVFLLFWFPVFLAFLMGGMMNAVKQGILIILPFMAIRKFSGGYHTNHLLTCLICSSLLLFLCIALSIRTKWNLKLFVITIVACASLVFFSPIEHKNRPISEKEKKVYKKVTTVLAVIFLMLVVSLKIIGLRDEAVSIEFGIILTAGLQGPCIANMVIKKTKQV